MHFAGDGGDDVFAGLDGDAGVYPGLIAGDGDVLRHAAFAGGDGGGGAAVWACCVWRQAVVAAWRGAVVAEELALATHGVMFGGGCAGAEGRNPNNGPAHPISTHGCLSLRKLLRTKNLHFSVSRCVWGTQALAGLVAGAGSSIT